MVLSRTVSEINGDFSQKSQKKISPSCTLCPAEGFPLELDTGTKGQKTTVMGLPGREKRFSDLDTMH